MRYMDINLIEHGEFYSTDEIKEILPAGLFREMECHVTTFMFINNK
jgi:hypothetical protein